MMSGDLIEVRHPEAVRFSGDLAGYIDTDGRTRVFDAGSVCQVLEIPSGEGIPLGDEPEI